MNKNLRRLIIVFSIGIIFLSSLYFLPILNTEFVATPTLVNTIFRGHINLDSPCREGTNDTFKLVGIITQGRDVLLLGKDSNFPQWLLIRYGSFDCWVEARFVTTNDTSFVNIINTPLLYTFTPTLTRTLTSTYAPNNPTKTPVEFTKLPTVIWTLSNTPALCPSLQQFTLSGNRKGQEVNLSWTSVPGATSYQVFRSVNYGNFSLIGNTNIDIIPIGTIHQYYVFAMNSCGNSVESNVITVNTNPGEPLSATQTIEAVYKEVDKQFQELKKAYIAYNAPEIMNLNDTVTIELLINPSVLQPTIVSQAVDRGEERGDYVTSTAEPGRLVDEQGRDPDIHTSEIQITSLLKAELISKDAEAFIVQSSHDNAVQPISNIETTIWRWNVTAQKRGEQTLELVIYRLVKIEDTDYWREVETYRTDIDVEITYLQWFEESLGLDWRWLLTTLLIPLLFWWMTQRNKMSDEKPSLKKKKQKKKK